MFKSYSMTITALVVALLGSIFPVAEVETVAEGLEHIVQELFVIIPILVAWFARFRVGDISLLGFRK